tara:strand:+ start:182 stop:358 length:177 start_codon:yes stop_codon:yes gene_type:complete
MDNNDNDNNINDDHQAPFMNCDEIKLVHGEIESILRKEIDVLKKMTVSKVLKSPKSDN